MIENGENMKKRIGILLVVFFLVALAGCSAGDTRQSKMDEGGSGMNLPVEALVKRDLEQLKALGIGSSQNPQSVVDSVEKMPADMLSDMDEQQIFWLVLGIMRSEHVYSFDTEIFDITRMYSDFLEHIETLTNGDLQFGNLSEEIDHSSPEAKEAGQEIHIVRFTFEGKEYEYKAYVDGDWFNGSIFAFLNRILEEHYTEKYLFVGGDGQDCFVFYATDDWVQAFEEQTKVKLEKD